jgi:PHD/YefM family antitoxin component YafN of YafNO toxin-antitoxin module
MGDVHNQPTRKSSRKPNVVVDDGKPVAVILSLAAYEALLEKAEQAAELRAIPLQRVFRC